MPMWPPELDALIAAPRHHRLLLENETVRVLETVVEPGDLVPVHTHQWPGVSYILSWSAFIRRNELGEITLDTEKANVVRTPGTALWQDILEPHSLENVGDSVLRVVTVEMKSSPLSPHSPENS